MHAGGYLNLAIEGQGTSADVSDAHTVLFWADEGDPRTLERSRQVWVAISRSNFLTEAVEHAGVPDPRDSP